jgi:prephenate dehydrogenase
MRVAFLGFGLIGGSIARALRGAGGWPEARLVAWTPSGAGPVQAVADGVLDAVAGTPAEAVGGADLIVLAAPPIDCLALLDELAGPLRSALAPTATVTDVASTKAAIVARATTHGLPFVGGHPMAGRETSGYGAASADLFADRPWVVVPGADAVDRDVDLVEALAVASGARPLRMDAATHDAALAGTSHLPLVLAAALVESVAGSSGDPARPGRPFVPALTAGGWQDMTRLARGDVAMGTGIVATNGPALASRIRDLRDVLDGWLAELERPGGPDLDGMAIRLRVARDRLERLSDG